MLKHFFSAFLLLVSLPAWSLVEVRMTYMGLNNAPDKSQLYNGSGTIPKTKATAGIGGDLMIYLPVTSFGLGVRYENLSMNYKGNGVEFDGDGTRTAAVLGWRMLDTLAYFGPVFTYGFSHSGGNMKTTDTSSTVAKLSADSQSSYTAGLELGAKLIGFRIGVEAGYMNYIWKDLKGSSGSITSVKKIDLSGTYAKVLIGFSI